MVVARHVVEQAIGEHLDGTPIEEPKNPKKAKAGRKGGRKRAEILSAKRRSEIARKAAKTRWQGGDSGPTS